MDFLGTAITGLVRPEGGFDLIASTMGVLTLVLFASFVYFGLNDPTTEKVPQVSSIKGSNLLPPWAKK